MRTYFIWSFLVLGIFALPSFVASAQSREPLSASVSGDISRLRALDQRAQYLPCFDQACALQIKPLRLSVNLPGQAGMQVMLTRGEHARKIDRSSAIASSPVPLLLRGIVQMRSGPTTRSRKTYPASAIVRGKGNSRRIELFVPRKARDAGSPSSRLVRIRASFPKSMQTSKLIGHAEFVSAYAFPDIRCPHETIPLRRSSSKRIKPLPTSKLVDATALKRVWLATDTDADFDASQGQDGNDEILAIVNASSAFYEAQLGSSLSVIRQRRSSDIVATPPYSSSTAETLLTQFRSYVNNTSRLGTADSYILFSGKRINDSVIGIAYTGATCVERTYSFVMNQYISAVINPIILAHESGHGLGSPHFDRVLEIMNTSLGNRLPSTFSTDSQAVITDHLSRYYADGCLGSLGDGTPTPSSPTATPSPTPPQAQPLPTVTPGPPAGGKGGTGTIPNGSDGAVPNSMLMHLKLTKSGELTLSLDSPAYREGCTIAITSGKTRQSSRASEAPIVSQFTPSSEFSTITAQIPFSVRNMGVTAKGLIFYASNLICDGLVVERSVAVRSDPSKVQARMISRTTYLRQLPTLLSAAR